MHLIVGLGNPGPRYEATPHNLGFLTVDRLAEQNGIRVVRPEAGSLVGRGEIEGKPVLLAKPLSFMNLSGGPVKSLLGKYDLTPGQLVVVFDELALPWGTLRLRERGSAGGHRGMKSVIRALGTNEFLRLRIGIQPDHPVDDGAEFVLRPLPQAKREQLEDILEEAVEAIRLLLSVGAAKAMTMINRRAEGTVEET